MKAGNLYGAALLCGRLLTVLVLGHSRSTYRTWLPRVFSGLKTRRFNSGRRLVSADRGRLPEQWLDEGDQFLLAQVAGVVPLHDALTVRRWCADAGRPTRFKPSSPSPTDAVRDGSATLGHLVQNVTREHGLTPLPR